MYSLATKNFVKHFVIAFVNETKRREQPEKHSKIEVNELHESARRDRLWDEESLHSTSNFNSNRVAYDFLMESNRKVARNHKFIYKAEN